MYSDISTILLQSSIKSFDNSIECSTKLKGLLFCDPFLFYTNWLGCSIDFRQPIQYSNLSIYGSLILTLNYIQ